MNKPLGHRSLAAAGGMALLATCSSGLTTDVADKTGGETITLHLATIDGEVNSSGQAYGPEAFVDSLDAVSGGRLQVEVTTVYGDGTGSWPS